jgi:hypothetical protein
MHALSKVALIAQAATPTVVALAANASLRRCAPPLTHRGIPHLEHTSPKEQRCRFMLHNQRWSDESDEHQSASSSAGDRSDWHRSQRSYPMTSADAASFTLLADVAHP